MSNSFSTGRVETSPGQNDSGSVSVAILDHCAGPADENPLRQRQGGLGSRTASAACHRRVGGRHQHHLSARPLGILNEGRFDRGDSAVRGLARHPRLGQKLWLEVLHRQRPMISNDFGGPLARSILPLPGDFLGQLGNGALSAEVALGRRLAAGRLAPRHRSLPSGQLCAGTLAVFRMPQIVLRVGGSRHCAHAPVDADGPLAPRHRLVVSAHHEAGVPMPNAVAVDAHTARIRRQLTRPHHWNAQGAGQTQLAVFHGESSFGVVQARPTALGGFEFAAPATLTPLSAEISQHLLLGHYRTLAHPIVLAPPTCQRVVAYPLTEVVKPLNRLIPHPPAAVPLSQQSRHSGRARAQPVPITHDAHAANAIVAVRQHRRSLPDQHAEAYRAAHR